MQVPNSDARDRLSPSGKDSPCPICGRTKDGDCRIGADIVLCHRGASNGPPAGLRKGVTVHGTWAYTGETADGRAAMFVPVKPLSPGKRKPHLAVVPPPSSNGTTSKPPAVVVARMTWDYTDADGVPIIRVHRHDLSDGDKKMWQESLMPGRMPKELLPSARPYGWQQAQQALADDPAAFVFWVEGEKCVDALQSIGLAAVTSIGGAGKFKLDRDGGLFPPDRVVVCPDRDQKGIEHAHDVAAAHQGCRWLLAEPDSPAWQDLPAAHGFDIADWIAAGATQEQITLATRHGMTPPPAPPSTAPEPAEPCAGSAVPLHSDSIDDTFERLVVGISNLALVRMDRPGQFADAKRELFDRAAQLIHAAAPEDQASLQDDIKREFTSLEDIGVGAKVFNQSINPRLAALKQQGTAHAAAPNATLPGSTPQRQQRTSQASMPCSPRSVTAGPQTGNARSSPRGTCTSRCAARSTGGCASTNVPSPPASTGSPPSPQMLRGYTSSSTLAAG